MSDEINPAILDINKWALKTSECVARDCRDANAPCIGYALVFITGPGEFTFKFRMATDPNNPPPDKEIQDIELSLERAAEAIAKIMGGQKQELDDLDEFTIKGTFH